MYVSPEPDGWTLVVGPWRDPAGAERADGVLRLCVELSERYGPVQAYYYDGRQGGGSPPPELGISPLELMAGTPVRGTGVLALTPHLPTP